VKTARTATVLAAWERIARTEGDNGVKRKAIDPLKKHLPAVMVSGKFSRRAGDALLHHSELICADPDSLDKKLHEVHGALYFSKYLYALFLSPLSGGLLRRLFRIIRTLYPILRKLFRIGSWFTDTLQIRT
jgi:VirE-like protein